MVIRRLNRKKKNSVKDSKWETGPRTQNNRTQAPCSNESDLLALTEP